MDDNRENAVNAHVRNTVTLELRWSKQENETD